MSLLAAVLVAGSAAFLAAPVAVLVDSVVAAPGVRRAIVTWSCGVGLLRGAITFTTLRADRVLVVNPVRIHRRAVGDVERICSTRLGLRPGRWEVLAAAVRGRRRPIALWSAPLSDMLIPPLRQRQTARLLTVHAWSVRQGIGPCMGWIRTLMGRRFLRPAGTTPPDRKCGWRTKGHLRRSFVVSEEL